MKTILVSYQLTNWGDFFVVVTFVGVVFFIQLKDSGYFDLIRESLRLVRVYYRMKRKTRRQLRRKMRSLYIIEKRMQNKRQVRRIRRRLYRLWSPYAVQNKSLTMPDFEKGVQNEYR